MSSKEPDKEQRTTSADLEGWIDELFAEPLTPEQLASNRAQNPAAADQLKRIRAILAGKFDEGS